LIALISGIDFNFLQENCLLANKKDTAEKVRVVSVEPKVRVRGKNSWNFI